MEHSVEYIFRNVSQSEPQKMTKYFRFLWNDNDFFHQISLIFDQETDIEKYVRLNDSTETHDSISNATIQRIRGGKHIIIDWETNLLHVLRKEYLETDKCEFTLSKCW